VKKPAKSKTVIQLKLEKYKKPAPKKKTGVKRKREEEISGSQNRKRKKIEASSQSKSQPKATPTRCSQRLKKEVVYLLTKNTLKKSTKETLKKLRKKYGATFLEKFDPSVTHLVADIPRRTLKYLCGLGNAQHLVTTKWLQECARVFNFNVDEEDYFPNGKESKKAQKEMKFNLKDSFSKAQTRDLFSGYKLHVNPKHPAYEERFVPYKKMFETYGGQIVKKLPSKLKDDILILSAEGRPENEKWKKKGWKVFDGKVIGTSILRQELNMNAKEFAL